MKKLLFFASLLCIVMMFDSCKKDELVPEGEMPSWLGSSIYGELSNPKSLQGSFKYYLQLIDDLDYDEVLSKTGSKTIFPANDEAFEAFFRNNKWNVSSYDELTTEMKSLLLYSSMLDNALLLEMLPNTSSGTTNEIIKGQAIKHATNLSLVNSIVDVKKENYPKNKYWDLITDNSIKAVYDASVPMLVHFTREYMLNNNITTKADASGINDFKIITGSQSEDACDTVFIFDNKVIEGNVTCQNGYIHQLENVLVPPGNMAQLLRESSNTSYFSHMLEFLSVPEESQAVTQDYQSLKKSTDKVYNVRYLSGRSEDGKAYSTDPITKVTASAYLNYDPGWNQYYPASSTTSGIDNSITDIGAMFVPTNDALWQYFGKDGNGAYIINEYGDYQNNDSTDFLKNLDALHSKKPEVLPTFVNNLMKASFASTVPSKFTEITNDANEDMLIRVDSLMKKADGTYDVRIANNGVIYMMRSVLAPDEYASVMGPSTIYRNMSIMGDFIKRDQTKGSYRSKFGDMYYYLLAMKSHYAFFTPTNDAFEKYYVDVTTLGKAEPEALKFYFDETQPNVRVSYQRYKYDPKTGKVSDPVGEPAAAADDNNGRTSQVTDLLNYHTVVLDDGEVFGRNNYYVTKGGGAIKVNFTGGDSLVWGELQDDGKWEKSRITGYQNSKNGTAFFIDHLIQPTATSIYSVLNDESNGERFSEFLKICGLFEQSSLLEWAGISADIIGTTGKSQQDRYLVFTDEEQKCLDLNVNFLSSFNYTVYAPNNTAMDKAYALGLPTYETVYALYEKHYDDIKSQYADSEEADKTLAKAYIDILRDFVRYHFQNNSVFADNVVKSAEYQTLDIDELGLPQKVQVSGGSGTLVVTDNSGVAHEIKSTQGGLVNVFARDMVFDDKKTANPKKISSSAFAVVHEVSDALNFESNGRYDKDERLK